MSLVKYLSLTAVLLCVFSSAAPTEMMYSNGDYIFNDTLQASDVRPLKEDGESLEDVVRDSEEEVINQSGKPVVSPVRVRIGRNWRLRSCIRKCFFLNSKCHQKCVKKYALREK
ncbi:unnamed protein product [Calicophoron daubneyi]|uniref:Uncharacterized protein n=1 Tax=Calicophoron daubneyi TaxID=300641 RepID=A0AAV2TE40_CALDB